MLSALIWVGIFIAIAAAAMSLRRQMRNDEGIRGWYERVVKDRLDLLKKIVIYGTLVLWAGIWLATRGDEKGSVSDLLQDFSSSWSKQDNRQPSAKPGP